MNAAHRFPGGLRLEPNRAISTRHPVTAVPLPERLILPLGAALGAPAQPCVSEGERVRAGQCLAEGEDPAVPPLHAPAGGRVAAITAHPAPHPSNLAVTSLVLETDPDAAAEPAWPALDAGADPAALRARVHAAGITGLGGAGFPTAAKLADAAGRVHTLVLNGAECEPWISCDDMLMRTRAAAVLSGGRLLARAVGAGRIVVALEADAEAALEAVTAAADDDVEVVTVPARYPAGGERQLVQALTGQEVPAGDLPTTLGILCQNVGTAEAVHRAAVEGRALTHRYVTVTGDAVADPRVVLAPLGAPFSDLLAAAGGATPGLDRLIMGGPMMGFTVADPAVPVVAATNCILAATTALCPPPQPALPCIRCGACAEACPASLQPQQLYWHARGGEVDTLAALGLGDCIECGACAYVCPSHIPLIQYFRHGKAEMADARQARTIAERARERYEARQARLAREAEERRQRREQKKAQARSGGDARKAAVAAALEKRRRRRGTAESDGDDGGRP
ncbi:electron transport complex subunit RsxC [Arhodomonas aquaeolei]|uniref:electron transport complex subunit RsxC n=1 Tax=Arhodomonas aquaeolei TaxID=2369 RepID=UPI00036AB5FE|nr:electron transport complex subunit RsxC [Arhodomonas aquaeolei]